MSSRNVCLFDWTQSVSGCSRWHHLHFSTEFWCWRFLTTLKILSCNEKSSNTRARSYITLFLRLTKRLRYKCVEENPYKDIFTKCIRGKGWETGVFRHWITIWRCFRLSIREVWKWVEEEPKEEWSGFWLKHLSLSWRLGAEARRSLKSSTPSFKG